MRAVGGAYGRVSDRRAPADPHRAQQRSALALSIAAPFFVSAAAWTLLPAAFGLGTTFAFISAAFGTSGAVALALMATRRSHAIMSVALVLAGVQLAVLIAAAGGLASPVALIALALPLEAWLSGRARQPVLIGLATMLAALAIQVVPDVALASNGTPAAWHWAIPLAYGALTMPRLRAAYRQAIDDATHASRPDVDPDRVRVRFAANGDLIDIEASSDDLLTIDPDLLIGRGFFDRIHVADRVKFLCALAELRDGAASRKIESRVRLPHSGAPETVPHYRAVAIELSGNAEAQAFSGILRDNSEVAALRSALEAAQDASGGMEATKSRFLAAVSHELRTPLNSIIGFSDLLLCEIHGPLPDPRQREHIEIVREAGHHLLAVVNSILDVSKIEAGSYTTNPEPFRFGDAAALCASMVRLQADAKGIALSTDIPISTGELSADRRAIQQVLLNLLSNAIKFTPDGGAVCLGAKRIGSRLHFWVTDNGIGIEADDLDRLGQPFMQVQNDYTRRFEGTGLGLALVKGLVALHEGTMSIDSAIGEGTTVTITLPIAGPVASHPVPPPMRVGTEPSEEGTDGSLRKAG